ncbi:FHA domain-containing protein [endosymbiont of Riftia pachyptila]|uniref:FHA domain-containing protein n=1 Tax=endosymbiont of Riftia pachyptila TaxID=54396 RepID=UPI000586D01F|nr:FHA domain-containing protein [endosymbiont of Riftia pachyptila]
MEKLVMIDKGRVLREVDLSGKRVMIGRDPMSDICLNDTSVSRHHAAVVRIFNEYFLEDLRSTNGTKLNGHEIRNTSSSMATESTWASLSLNFRWARTEHKSLSWIELWCFIRRINAAQPLWKKQRIKR